jgi:hypothetical protein
MNLHSKLTLGGLLVTLIVVMWNLSTIRNEKPSLVIAFINTDIVWRGFSVFRTLTKLQSAYTSVTTAKVDFFALYALVKKQVND